ncbi:MAG: hypothetical protein H0V12_08035 [Chloroflexi bacterium]|nr:hypothetical protein [Chloroflexota bacterium]
MGRTAELATWEEETLARLLQDLAAEDALEGVGFSAADVSKLIDELLDDQEPELEDPGPEELPEQPITRSGDLWILGDHGILCGDSTSAEDVARIRSRPP